VSQSLETTKNEEFFFAFCVSFVLFPIGPLLVLIVWACSAWSKRKKRLATEAAARPVPRSKQLEEIRRKYAENIRFAQAIADPETKLAALSHAENVYRMNIAKLMEE
jgi:hypothetical protein